MHTVDFKTRSTIIERKNPCPDGTWPIAIDIGYSGVKGMCPNKLFCFPAYARKIPPDRVTLTSPSPTDIQYRDESGTWAVGALAYDEIKATDVTDSEAELRGQHRYYSDMFRVTSRTGLALALSGNRYGKSTNLTLAVKTGLPAKYMKSDKDLIRDAMSGRHQFELKIGASEWHKYDLTIPQDKIGVMPQPLGALLSATVGKDGCPVDDASKYFTSKVVVFDPGFGTMDDYTIEKGRVISSETFPDLGMGEVFTRTCKKIGDKYKVTISPSGLQKLLDNGEVKVMDRKAMKRHTYSFTDILDECSREVCMDAFRKMNSVHDYFSDVDYIIATGGTYDAWASQWRDFFAEMDDLHIVPGNVNDTTLPNIYSNVRGYYFSLCNDMANAREG